MKNEWTTEYPAMPESFHNALLEALSLEEGEAHRITNEKRKGRRSVLAVGAAAAALLLAAAGMYRGLGTFFPETFLSEAAKEGIKTEVVTEISGPDHYARDLEGGSVDMDSLPVIPVDEPLIRILEAKCDGIELFAVMEKTEAAKNYDIALHELYIDDVLNEEPPSCMAESEDTFALRADVTKRNPGPVFRATLAVNVYGRDGMRYQNQELTFEMAGGGGVVRRLPEEQVFEHDACNVTVLSAAASANCLRIELATELGEELRETEGVHFTILSENGEELHVLEGTRKETDDGLSDVFIVSGYTEVPARVGIAVRIGKKGEPYSLIPVSYTDWITLM